MNLNSQSLFDPRQPDNPTDSDRYSLAKSALTQRGWPEDLDLILSLMSPPPDITNFAEPGECGNLRVGVIGGGLAGLSAAYELRKVGFDITVFDALRDRIGGRVYTYYFDRRKKLYHELGPMRIPVTHETVWHYLNTFHLPTRPFIQYNPETFIYLKKTRVRNDRNGSNVAKRIYPKYRLTDWERELNWQKLFYIGIDSHLLGGTQEERSEIIRVKPIYSQKALEWGDNTGLRLMQSANLSQDAIELVSNFQPLLYSNLYHSYIDYVQEVYPADTDYVYEIPGGMSRLPMAFYHALTQPEPYPEIDAAGLRKVTFRRGTWVQSIGYDGRTKKVRLRCRQPASGKEAEEQFDYVVCAIPFSTLRMMELDPLFSDIKMRAVREVQYISSQKTLFLCRERFWERQGMIGGGSYTDLPIASIWYPSDHAGSSARNPLSRPEPGVLVASYNFNLDTTRLTGQAQADIFEEVRREVEQVHGLPQRYLDDVVEGFKTQNWDIQPTIRGALSFFSPEQKRLFSYGMTLPEYDDRIFFAGEHISPIHRWMQGALQSGMQAANDLAAASRKRRGSS